MGSSYTSIRRRLTGLQTNADRDLRMSPADREQAGIDDLNDSLMEQAVFDGQRRAAKLDPFAHAPEIVAPDSERMVVRDSRGVVHGQALSVTPQKVRDVASWRGRRLKPAGWKPRNGVGEWPFPVMPVGLPETAWESIVDGWHCLRCCNPLEDRGGDCECCGLTSDRRAWAFKVLEDMAEVTYDRPGETRMASGLVIPN